MVDSATQLGQLLGSLSNQQSKLSQNISPDDSDPLLTLYTNDEIIVEGTFSASSKIYPTDSFILDHPIYCDIDSSVLKIDGGYASSLIYFPLTFPFSLGLQGTILYTTIL
jgi:hypothetical protein